MITLADFKLLDPYFSDLTRRHRFTVSIFCHVSETSCFSQQSFPVKFRNGKSKFQPAATSRLFRAVNTIKKGGQK